ncbi:MAG: MBL fold metallo-hydrolase, partial [Rhizobiaceae bacterium]|nr:MBL fold metallo-hydrolase [Rhizobiaceae bacterium]
ITSDDGKILIDAGIAVSRPRIEEALTALGTQPIVRLINTHWHLDHTSGNEWVHGEGAVILAHVDTLKHLSSDHRVPDWDYNFPAAPAGALPTELMNAERHVKSGDETLFLKHYDPAHTDCDISVYFQEADILHTGDTFWNGVYPFIDYSTGGSLDGMIKAAEANVKTATNKTIIIPGHGPLGTKKDLVAYRDMLVAIHGNVVKLKKKGHSVDEVVAAKPTAKFDAKWGKFVIDPVFFTQLVYEGA